MLVQAYQSTCDYVGIIKPEVFISKPEALAKRLARFPANALIYGGKHGVNSLTILDGIADGYGYFFCAPQTLRDFAPGDLSFGSDWWVHWLLMSALAKDLPVKKLDSVFAYRVRKFRQTFVDEQKRSSAACISSVLSQYLPTEFRNIPSLKLSFDVESQDFEQFARSFVASRAA